MKKRESKADEDARDKMITKLFSLYPPPPDFVASMAGYIEETRDIPPLFLSHALARLRDQPVNDRGSMVPRRWLPSISEIRYEAARVIREAKLRSEGRDPNAYTTAAAFFEPERWLLKGPELAQRIQLAAKQITAGERK